MPYIKWLNTMVELFPKRQKQDAEKLLYNYWDTSKPLALNQGVLLWKNISFTAINGWLSGKIKMEIAKMIFITAAFGLYSLYGINDIEIAKATPIKFLYQHIESLEENQRLAALKGHLHYLNMNLFGNTK